MTETRNRPGLTSGAASQQVGETSSQSTYSGAEFRLPARDLADPEACQPSTEGAGVSCKPSNPCREDNCMYCPPSGAAGEEESPERESASTVLVKLAMARYDFGVADNGETYAVPKTGPKVVQMLRGGKTSLRSQLSRIYFAAKGKAAPQQALADALLVLQGMAEEEPESTLYQRVARHSGALWLDLGDPTGRAVRIAEGKWTVEESAPVLFRRTALNAPLPEPAWGGSLDELWSWLNVTEDDRPLLAAWLVAALYDSIPHPVLGLFGEQGTGKTTAEKVLVSILDPSPVPSRKPPKDADSWVTAAQGSWVVGLDNLSTMPDWLSDSLCRAVTGDGDVRRQLYADNALVVFAFRRCLVVTGIDLGALNGDLADRLLTINLDVIPDENRLDEEELWPRWSEVHPLILGAVLDLAASVQALLPSVRLARKPRMADFAKILRAVDQVLGTDGLSRYMQAQHKMAADALTGDPFVTLLADAIAGTFIGTAKELLALVVPADEKWRPPKGWPANARAVTTKLHKQAPVMRKAGWTVTDDGGANHDNAVRWTIGRPEKAGKSDSPDSQTRGGEALQGVVRELASHASHESGPSQDDPARCPRCGGPVWLGSGKCQGACS